MLGPDMPASPRCRGWASGARSTVYFPGIAVPGGKTMRTLQDRSVVDWHTGLTTLKLAELTGGFGELVVIVCDPPHQAPAFPLGDLLEACARTLPQGAANDRDRGQMSPSQW